MKKLFLATAVLLASTGAQAGELNLFSCASEDGTVEIGYSSSSFTGQPQLSVTVDHEVVFPPARGQFQTMVQIKTEESVFGTFVYGIDSSRTPLDAPNYIYGFFIPQVSIQDNQPTAKFESVFLNGSTGGFIPQWVPAQRIHAATKIKCEGQAVIF